MKEPEFYDLRVSSKFGAIREARMPCLLGKKDADCMPFAVKVDIVSKYMYRDIGQNLLDQQMDDSYFIYSLYRNLKPRMYIADDLDKTIVEEGQFVDEALLI